MPNRQRIAAQAADTARVVAAVAVGVWFGLQLDHVLAALRG